MVENSADLAVHNQSLKVFSTNTFFLADQQCKLSNQTAKVFSAKMFLDSNPLKFSTTKILCHTIFNVQKIKMSGAIWVYDVAVLIVMVITNK